MKKFKKSLIAMFLFTFCMLASTQIMQVKAEQMPKVTRDKDGYIKITSEKDFKAMTGAYANDKFRIMNNIKMSNSYETVGSVETPFTGVLDGNKKSIKNLKKTLLKYVGAATIKNLTIDKPQIVVDGERGVCSGAAGIAYSSQADYTNCHVKGGSISFTYKDTDDNASVISVAGLSVGGRTFTNCSNSAEIKVVTTNTTGTTVCGIATRAIKVNKCKNEGTISVNSIQADMIAGVAGFADKMIDCSNSGTINAISRQVDIVSGVAGETARITRCNNFGKIKVSGGCASIGGVVATAYNQIIFCKNTGNISGKIYKGIFGYETSIGGVASGYGKAVKCVNSGKIKLTIREIPKVTVGGVCGTVGSSFFCKNLSSIKINYSSKNSSNADSYIGGVFGEQNGKAQYCYNKGNIILKGISGQVGGVVGHAWLIRECCNTGDIKCTGGRNGGCFGGLVGYLGSNEKTFIGNYAAGKIKTSSNKHKTGALVGFGYNNYIKYVKICKGNCYSYGKQAFGRPKKYKNVKTKAKKITVSEMRILCEKRFKKIDKRIKKK